MLKQRVLGRTNLSVSELSLGGLFLGPNRALEGNDAMTIVSRAVKLGVNYVDTAPSYHNSEIGLGAALKELNAPLIVSTKLGGRPTPFNPKNKKGLRKSFEESLKNLGRDIIDILFIHEPDRPGQYDWWEDHNHYNGPVTEVLDELKKEGLVRFTGLGGTTAYELAPIIDTGKFDVVLTAFNYSILWREAEHCVLPAAVKQNMGIIVGSPLQQGWLAQRWPDEILDQSKWLSPSRRNQFKQLYRLADELDIPLHELCLRWVLSNSNVSTVLTGARSTTELNENAASVLKGPLPEDVLKQIREIADLVPFRPFEEPFVCMLGREYHGPGPAVS